MQLMDQFVQGAESAQSERDEKQPYLGSSTFNVQPQLKLKGGKSAAAEQNGHVNQTPT